MERTERFRIFIQELNVAAPVNSDEKARSLLEEVLNSVEDRYSGVEFDPAAWRNDGRMYPPAEDYERKSPYTGVRVFRTKGHYVLFASNGAIKIVSAKFPLGSPDAAIFLDKAGADGRCCP